MFLFVLKAHFLLWGLSIHFRTLIKFTRHHHQFTYLDRAQNLAAFHEISKKHFTENWGQSQDLVKFFIDLGRVSGRDKPHAKYFPEENPTSDPRFEPSHGGGTRLKQIGADTLPHAPSTRTQL